MPIGHEGRSATCVGAQGALVKPRHLPIDQNPVRRRPRSAAGRVQRRPTSHRRHRGGRATRFGRDQGGVCDDAADSRAATAPGARLRAGTAMAPGGSSPAPSISSARTRSMVATGAPRAPPIPAFRALLLPGEPLADPRDHGDEESVGVGKPRCHEKAVSR